MKKVKKIIKENIFYVIPLIIIISLFTIKLPYYIMAPGGTISLENRIDTSEKKDFNGSINMLYVTEFQGSIAFYVLAKVLDNWDIESIEKQQVSDENMQEIEKRNKIMLDNSLQNAIFVAYQNASKKVTIKERHNLVLATIEDYNMPLKIGDEIVKADGVKVNSVEELKKIISNKEIGSDLTLNIIRDQKEEEIFVEIADDHKIGVVIVTNYEYELDPEIEVNFKKSEGGSSGGLMLSLSIYQTITNEDIIKGRNIAGTGTIDQDGNVGEIDGIKYKIMGAVKKKMDVVLVPEANYPEALKVKRENNYNIIIVKVKTFEDALKYLNKK